MALRCRLGEPAAFAELVARMERPLLYFARSIVRDDDAAMDVLQAVWMTAFRGLRRLEEPSALRTWLYRVTRGHAVGHVRRDVARASAERSLAEDAEEASPPEDDGRFDAEDAAAVHRALDALDVRHREVLVLHFLEDMPVADVAAVVGCPPGTVKSRIFHAKRALKEALRRQGHGT
ncbi:RNA polymerase sigma factor SigV [Aquisphaera giovannonii]|uniref:RNA polymerase sigma factor SigV n=1 Tax=Aquisphaera giovannonii TaxID=406548 RepID=A0A5B9W5M1_9BACT|nr:sigma-70 family RNA polymerase sigma factor [Aquisphaera giovannonii]QEH35415.1 RNA polymerase sigma factor SigV [Aquisphaera giovannonii]